MDKSQFLELLRYLIDECNVQRSTLAEKMGVSNTTVTNYYLGVTEPSNAALSRVAAALEAVLMYDDMIYQKQKRDSKETIEYFSNALIDFKNKSFSASERISDYKTSTRGAP